MKKFSQKEIVHSQSKNTKKKINCKCKIIDFKPIEVKATLYKVLPTQETQLSDQVSVRLISEMRL